MFCPKCGSKNDDDSGFCAQCGSALPPKKNVTVDETHNRKKGVPVFAIIIICLVVFIAAGVGAMYYFGVDTSRIPIISSLFPRTSFTKETRTLFPVKVDGKMGYIDKNGKIIISPQFEAAAFFRENLGAVMIDNKWGFIDSTGKIRINPQFDDLSIRYYGFTDGLAAVRINGKYGFIDKTGKIVINPQFDFRDMQEFSESLAPVKVSGKWGFMDKAGEIVINPRYKEVTNFSDGLAYAVADAESGFIDTSGTFVPPLRFRTTRVSHFSEGLACIYTNDGEWGYIDKSGRLVFTLPHDGAICDGEGFREGMAILLIADQRENKVGFMDRKGKIVISPHFFGVQPFSEGLAAVVVRDTSGAIKFGYIDKTGKTVITPRFDRAEEFNGGLARVFVGEGESQKIGYINKTGSYIWEPSR